MALADRLASMRCGPSPGASNSALPSWSAVSAMAVSASGTRSSASARRISASPSALEIGYSRSSDSIAQKGAGVSRTPCTQGAARLHRDAPVEPAGDRRAQRGVEHLAFGAVGVGQAGVRAAG